MLVRPQPPLPTGVLPTPPVFISLRFSFERRRWPPVRRPRQLPKLAGVAQSAEQFIRNEQVVGSIPTVSSNPHFFSFFTFIPPPHRTKPSQTTQLKIKFQPHSLWGLHPFQIIKYAGIAQLEERRLCNPQVGGSNPPTSSTFNLTLYGVHLVIYADVV